MSDAIAILRDPATIRARCHGLLEQGLAGNLSHWSVDLAPWEALVDFVADHIERNYPTLDVPYHSRIRHFDDPALTRSEAFSEAIRELSQVEQGRAWYDLIVVSVLVDAGAGSLWKYHETQTGRVYARSEGLAIASYRMFEAGLFSSDPAQPLRADAARLAALGVDELADAFQVSAENPMTGLEGRVALLQSLGRVILENPEGFCGTGRPGGLFDRLHSSTGTVDAASVLAVVLETLGDIWPGRVFVDGVNLGDVWPHTLAAGPGETQGLVPFHKLSQWLTYSLLEPLEFVGQRVLGLDRLTGLAEYRNGGLFVDGGILTMKDPDNMHQTHATGSALVVEWRACTVALLDRMGVDICAKFGRTTETFPLARVLQGGTWSAGREIAAKHRADGRPPFDIERDGTVF